MPRGIAGNGKVSGRPRIEIDPKEFEKLCAIQCTLIEIAAWFKCSMDTIENFCKKYYKSTFSDAFTTYSAQGKMSLRRNQFRISETNCGMAIWLGKQYLGQKEEVNASISNTGMLSDILLFMKDKETEVDDEPDIK